MTVNNYIPVQTFSFLLGTLAQEPVFSCTCLTLVHVQLKVPSFLHIHVQFKYEPADVRFFLVALGHHLDNRPVLNAPKPILNWQDTPPTGVDDGLDRCCVFNEHHSRIDVWCISFSFTFFWCGDPTVFLYPLFKLYLVHHHKASGGPNSTICMSWGSGSVWNNIGFGPVPLLSN